MHEAPWLRVFRLRVGLFRKERSCGHHKTGSVGQGCAHGVLQGFAVAIRGSRGPACGKPSSEQLGKSFG